MGEHGEWFCLITGHKIEPLDKLLFGEKCSISSKI